MIILFYKDAEKLEKLIKSTIRQLTQKKLSYNVDGFCLDGTFTEIYQKTYKKSSYGLKMLHIEKIEENNLYIKFLVSVYIMQNEKLTKGNYIYKLDYENKITRQ